MILESVPTEDGDEEDILYEDSTESSIRQESTVDTSLVGRKSDVVGHFRTGTCSPDCTPKGHKVGKVAKVAKAAKVSKVAKVFGPKHHGLRLLLTVACCIVGVVGICVCVKLLQRYASENEAAIAAANDGVTHGFALAVFSYAASPTNAALAWLVAALRSGEDDDLLSVASAAPMSFFAPPGLAGPFVPDGDAVKIWPGGAPRPPASPPRVLAHGDVATRLLQNHSLGHPFVSELTTPEADAFLEIRGLLAQAVAEGTAGGVNGDGGQKLVLVSHPHHLPYLVALAGASGFEAQVLHPAVYSAVPWGAFGCDALGYPRGASPQAGVDRERERLSRYINELQAGDTQQLAMLQPVLRAANATLRFHRCVATWTAGAGGAAEPAHDSSINSSNYSSIAAACDARRR